MPSKRRVAVVTGAEAGIGRAVAEALAEQGHAVIAADRDEPAAPTPWSAAFFAAVVATDDLFRAAAGRLADDAKVVVVLSAGALDACAEPPPRAAAMAAARNLAQSWAFTLAPRGITVNAVCLPPRPSANPQGLITLVRFLLSPAAADMTAQTLQLG